MAKRRGERRLPAIREPIQQSQPRESMLHKGILGIQKLDRVPKIEIIKKAIGAAGNWLKSIKSGIKSGINKGHFLVINLRSPRFVIAITVVLTLVIGSIWYFGVANTAVAVVVDGHKVATVREKAEVDQAIKAVLEGVKDKTGLVPRMVSSIGYEKVRAGKADITGERELVSALAADLRVVVKATEVKINGKPELVVKDRETAEKLISRVKESYRPRSGEVESVTLAEKVEFFEREAAPAELASLDQAQVVIRNGSDQMKKYKVKEGDSLWTIARVNDMRVAELVAANPGLTENLSIDQEINLVKVEPLLHVLTTAKVASVQEIAPPVEVKIDRGLWRGQEKVQSPGTKGAKEVVLRVVSNNGAFVSRQVLSEKIIKKPSPRVVVRGRKLMVASRGDGDGGGDGRLAWPIRGEITSSFGRRGGEFHTGIDIDGVTGEAVRAAGDGTVIFAGREGGYGKFVIIDNGNGLVTRYAHNSEILVDVGQSVSRGQVISKVGDTGRSTGSHLHFEVLSNGDFENPLRYLR